MEREADKAYKLLRQRVVGGHYQPGTQLKEEPLGRELGLSRTPVRSALKRLVDEGLATANVGQGIRVAEWSDWDIEEMFQLRMLLEPHAAKLSAQRRGDEVIGELRASNEQMGAAITESGPDAISKVQEANRRFHRALLDSSGSPRLRAMLETIIDMPIIVRSFSLYTHAELEQSLHHHQDLTLAVEARDGDLAFQVMQLHLKMSYLRFMRHRSEFQRVP